MVAAPRSCHHRIALVCLIITSQILNGFTKFQILLTACIDGICIMTTQILLTIEEREVLRCCRFHQQFSIDCSLSRTTNSVEHATKLSYASYVALNDAGSNQNISVEHITPTLPKHYLEGARSCYVLRSLVAELKTLSTSCAQSSGTATTVASTSHPSSTSTPASTSGAG